MARLLSITHLIPTPTVETVEKSSESENTNYQEDKGESKSDNVNVAEKDSNVIIEWNHIEQKKYGLGKARTVEKFLRTFGINIVTQKIEHHLCRFVGKPMNEIFLAHRRGNGMGVDYDKISFEFKDPVEYGKSWDYENGDDCCEEEEEEQEEQEKQEEEAEEEEE